MSKKAFIICKAFNTEFVIIRALKDLHFTVLVLILHITRVSNQQNLLRKNAKFRENFRSYLAFFYENKFSERKRKRCGISWKKFAKNCEICMNKKCKISRKKNPKILAKLVLFRVFFPRKFSHFFFFERNAKKYEFSAKKQISWKDFPISLESLHLAFNPVQSLEKLV